MTETVCCLSDNHNQAVTGQRALPISFSGDLILGRIRVSGLTFALQAAVGRLTLGQGSWLSSSHPCRLRWNTLGLVQSHGRLWREACHRSGLCRSNLDLSRWSGTCPFYLCLPGLVTSIHWEQWRVKRFIFLHLSLLLLVTPLCHAC